MKNKILIIIFFVIISLVNYKSFSFARKNTDLFNEIISKVQGKTVEYGVKASFEINENGEDYCVDLLKKFNVTDGDVFITKTSKFYSLEFNKNEYKGYIEYSSYDKHNVVTINMIKADNLNRLVELRKDIEKAIGKNEKEVKYYMYLKAKVTESDNLKLNNEIISLLKEENAVNIDSVKIENGVSTVAYTKQFDAMKNNGKLMDLNFAVCNYLSGNYLIIGTPIIIEAY